MFLKMGTSCCHFENWRQHCPIWKWNGTRKEIQHVFILQTAGMIFWQKFLWAAKQRLSTDKLLRCVNLLRKKMGEPSFPCAMRQTSAVYATAKSLGMPKHKPY